MTALAVNHGSRGPGQGATVLLQDPEEEVRARRRRQIRLSVARITVPTHDRGALAAGKAPPTGVRILSDVFR